MNILQSLLVAVGMLRANKIRSFLTMLGIIIGVMAVTVTIEMVEGFRSYMNNQFASLGSNTVFVFYDPSGRRRGETLGGVGGLKQEDVEAIRDECSLVNLVSEELRLGAKTVSYGDLQLESTDVIGADGSYAEMHALQTDEGRFFTDTSSDKWANNVVLGYDVAQKLFPRGGAIGSDVIIDGRALRVIGTIKKKGQTLGEQEDKRVYVPASTAQKRWLGSDDVHVLLARPVSMADTDGAMDQMWQTLMRRHDNKQVFRIGSQEAMTAAFGGIITAFGAVFSAIAALSLLVGGIGIMNIMLVSVTERTREIGLRMAVGAKRYELLFQFLVEAATLSLIGGLIGMALGWGLGAAVDWFTHSPMAQGMPGITMTFPLWAAIGASLFSASVGLVFGIYPAWRAAKLDPIEALRHE